MVESIPTRQVTAGVTLIHEPEEARALASQLERLLRSVAAFLPQALLFTLTSHLLSTIKEENTK